MVFSWAPRHSRHWGGWRSRRFLESVLWGVGFTGGQCGWASLPPALSYNLLPSDKGIGTSARRYLVLSLQCAVMPFQGMWNPPDLVIWWSVDRLGTRYWKPPGVTDRSPGVSWARLCGWAVIGVPRYPGYKTLTILNVGFSELLFYFFFSTREWIRM
jgi:hypothetical protein